MLRVERLLRRPQELERLSEELGGADLEVLETVAPERLRAVGLSQTRLLIGRWWQPRFGPLLELAGDPLELARALVASPRYEQAADEDEDGRLFCLGLLDLLEQEPGRASGLFPGLEEGALRELLAYAYLLAVSLPRRAAGEAPDDEAEERLFSGRVRWLAGASPPSRVAGDLALAHFEHPVSELYAGVDPAELDASEQPELILFFFEDGGAGEVGISAAAGDALELLAQGADDAALSEALGVEEAGEILAGCLELGLLTG